MRRPRRLRQEFYDRPTLDVLRDLIGKVLVHEPNGCPTAGMIVEAEAYIGESDPACHAAPGPTIRNAPLYGPPGHAYVYLNYGVHYLVNAVTEFEGFPAAILIRALDPLDGIDVMHRRRRSAAPGRGRYGPVPREQLCRGPGNLSRALGIDLRLNRVDLATAPLGIEDRGIAPGPLGWSTRIGIRVGRSHRWRCYWRGHPAVSGPGTARV